VTIAALDLPAATLNRLRRRTHWSLVAGVALGSLAWVTLLATIVAIARRAAGERALRTADAIAGAGLIGFGTALAYGGVRAD